MFLRCLLLVVAVANTAYALKCFCDRDSCEDSLICNADYCIIGYRRDDDGVEHAKLHQLCGPSEPTPINARCEQDRDGWQEVCYCAEEFCNTFAHLRASMDRFSSDHSGQRSRESHDDGLYGVINNHEVTGGGRHQRNSLIVLLVIIPLSVGGLAVCLIFLNYHCKMC